MWSPASRLAAQLLNKQQELKITEASTVGDVRIVDPAITQPGVLPVLSVGLFGSIILGLMLSSASLRLLFNRKYSPQAAGGARDRQFMCQYSAVGMAKARDSVKTIKGIKRYKQSQLLAVGNPTDPAIEAIRSLRTSLHFAMMQAQNTYSCSQASAPIIGKTFVCANLAAVISQTHKRVLLIETAICGRATPMNCSAPITWTAYLTFWRAKAR